jgi:hypothetical protein
MTSLYLSAEVIPSGGRSGTGNRETKLPSRLGWTTTRVPCRPILLSRALRQTPLSNSSQAKT